MGYFGIPFRNGVPIGLGSVVSFGAPQEFSPSELFLGGTAGAWYDPSDLTTLFTTSAGTTQCAMPGQGSAVSVGLMLDKSQGLVLGSELIANPDFTTDTWWLKDAGVTISGGTANWAATAATFQIYKAGILTVGALYKVTFTITSISSGGLRAVAGSGTFGSTRTTPGTYTEYLVAAGSGTVAIQSVGASTTASIDNVSYQVLSGNHAIAFNDTTARPELRARVNLLTYSEEFDNAAWEKLNGVTISQNVAVAPNGTMTADKLIAPNSTGATRVVRQYISNAVVGVSYRTSFYAKFILGEFAWARCLVTDSGSVWFNIQTGTVGTQTGATGTITSVGDGWFLCTAVGAASSGFAYSYIQPVDADNSTTTTGDGSKGVLIWGADLRPANIGANVPAYQRIADANTYDTSGFPLYLRFDGIDDSMYTPANLNLSGTDKVAVFAGVRKLTDTTGFVAETSSAASANNGAFYKVVVPSSRWEVGLRGTSYIASALSTYTSPITNVLSTQYDISASGVANEIMPRVNGLTPTRTNFGSDCGTGNFGTYPLYIGSRNNSSDWFNGQVYGLLVVGSAVSAGNISATEQWVANKTGLALP